MTEKKTKQCPSCKKVSTGKKQIESNHGYRKVKTYIIPQSLCRKCRQLHKRSCAKTRQDNDSIVGLDLRQLGKEKSYDSLLNNKKVKSLSKSQLDKVVKLAKKNNLVFKKSGKATKTTWAKLSQSDKTQWVQSKKDNRSLWEKLSKEQKAKYEKAHKDYLRSADSKKKSSVKVTKKARIKKSKSMSNFKKDINTFAKSTQNKPKKTKR